MSESTVKTVPCGCEVRAYRDFLGRVVGTVLTRGPECPHPAHTPGQTIILPGREHARQE